jgi:hypothetical protein
MQTYSQHHTKWRTTETVPLKVRNETGLSAFPTLIQCSFGILSQSNETRAKNKRDSNREGRILTIPICRPPYPISKRPQNSTKTLLEIINSFGK